MYSNRSNYFEPCLVVSRSFRINPKFTVVCPGHSQCHTENDEDSSSISVTKFPTFFTSACFLIADCMGAIFSSSSAEDRIGDAIRRDPDLAPNSFPKLSGRVVSVAGKDGHSTRDVGYEEYGATAEKAVHSILFFHGTPGTRFFFSSRHEAYAASHNVRVIVPERPGFGLSTPDATRTIIDAASDAAKVLDAVSLSRVHIIGYSAGGPPALAFARSFPSRCISVAIVSSLSPNMRGILSEATFSSRVGYSIAAHSPGLLRFVIRLLARGTVQGVFNSSSSEFTTAENAYFAHRADVRRLFAKSTLELYSRPCGISAEAEDYYLMAHDWGFRLGDIDGDFKIWLYGGGRDNKCTPSMYQILCQQLPQDKLNKVFLPNENHLYFYKLFDGRLFSDLGII